ncbi:MAG: DUF503 domain-containing protein, partial [Actinobacteria bacterium]|nr:DUF503 domain-containing protein [Actinomycetota bacterium]
MTFNAGIVVFQLSLKSCMSLKDKRRILKSIIDRLGNNKIIGVSEISENDFWKSGSLGVVCISSSHDMVAGAFNKARSMIESSGVEIIGEERWIVNQEDLEAVL